jgi:hypothetical protein
MKSFAHSKNCTIVNIARSQNLIPVNLNLQKLYIGGNSLNYHDIMPSQPKSITQLPVLYNPLLNCIFNNPNHGKAPFKNAIDELRRHHTDFAIMVPPSVVLNECYDPMSENSSHKVLLRQLCYNSEDFIHSHIIKITSFASSVAPVSKLQLTIYTTMNGKQVLFKNGMVFTGKGYKKSLKLLILGNSYINSFSDYFPKGAKFMLIYIEDSLIGSYSRDSCKNTPIDYPIQSNADHLHEPVTFEKLLRNFPLLSTVVSDRFYRLFHHNNNKYRLIHSNTRKKLQSIKDEFNRLLDEAYSIILNSVKPGNAYGEQTYNLINHILELYPGLDLNKLVHEYVELNLYDKLWGQLLIQFNCTNEDKKTFDPIAMKVLTDEKYNTLASLSLNQLDIPLQTPWDSNLLQERIVKAIDELRKLEDTSIVNLCQKTNTLINAVNVLTDTTGTDLVIDADTLIGLLIMVVIHAKIDNFEAHLYYIKNFNSTDYTNDGQFNYITSNFDAVIYHLSSNFENCTSESDLVRQSYANFDLFSTIENGDIERLKEMLCVISKEFPNGALPANHFLKSKNLHGESALMIAIKSGNVDIFRLLLTYNFSWFSIDDILFDKNVITNSTLLMTAILEECDAIAYDLIEIIKVNCSDREKFLYFNSLDSSGRSIGHYFFHDMELIELIGHYIDWETKDMNSHTPLLSLCRCYDHPSYAILLRKVFMCIYKKYGRGKVNFDRHIDKAGNTLLHVILKDLDKTELLTDKENLINLDHLNSRNMTPLTVSVKYNRLEMFTELLKDQRLEFMFEDPKNFYNVFDYIGNLSGKSYETSVTFQEIERRSFEFYLQNYYPHVENTKLVAMNAKYDSNKRDWIIFFKSSTMATNQIYMDKLKQIIYITKLEYPLSTFPNEDTFWLNYKVGKTVIPLFHKYQINRLLENLNLLLISISYQKNIDPEILFQKLINSSSSLPKDEKLTFESIKHVNRLHELKRESFGVVELTSVNIQEIDVFLQFSLNDLQGYENHLSRLNKLIAVEDIKQTELQSSYDEALRKYDRLSAKYQSKYNCEYLQTHSSLNTLHSITMKLELTLLELTANINKLLLKTKFWKQLYDEIRELNSDITKFEEQLPIKPDAYTSKNPNHASVVTTTNTTNGSNIVANSNKSSTNASNTNASNTNASDDNSSGATTIANSSNSMEPVTSCGNNPSLLRRNTFTIHYLPDDYPFEETTNSFFNFSNIIENKRTRYKKLIMSKSEKVKQIMKLNIEIKSDHEIIAAEISNFLQFKAKFIQFAIKRYVFQSIKQCESRKYHLLKSQLHLV